MIDNTERKAFEKVCPLPEGVERDGDKYGLMIGYRHFCEQAQDCLCYNAKWQGFQLGRAQDADRKDAERYRWLRDQFELESEPREWEELVEEKKNGHRVYKTMVETFYSFRLRDDWRFGENVQGDKLPTFDDLLDLLMKVPNGN